MALPAVLVPTVLSLLLFKGGDLGKKEADEKAVAAAQKEREQSLSQRVEDPERAAMEEARLALEKAQVGGKLPPPPAASSELEIKSAEERMKDLIDAREQIGSTVNDQERQGLGMNDVQREDRKSYVVYTAPPKEGVMGAAVNAVTIEKKPEEEEPKKPFLSRNDDQVGKADTTMASRVDGMYWLAPGTVIRAVLLNAVDSAIPGQVTARTTEPIYDSRYGRHLVVPAGSKLIGQYDSAVAHGQKRLMMSFSSLVTPAGGVVDLAGIRVSDSVGRMGVGGELHTYFWQRMGVATLLAIESVALDRFTNSKTTIDATGVSSTTGNTSEAARIISDVAKNEPRLQPMAPHITIEEGQQISVITMTNIEIPPLANKR